MSDQARAFVLFWAPKVINLTLTKVNTLTLTYFRVCAECGDDAARAGARKAISAQRNMRHRHLGGMPREQGMLKGHLHRVIYHQVYL